MVEDEGGGQQSSLFLSGVYVSQFFQCFLPVHLDRIQMGYS